MVSIYLELFVPASQAESTAPESDLPSPQEFLISRPEPLSVSSKQAVSGNMAQVARSEETTSTASSQVLIPIDFKPHPAK